MLVGDMPYDVTDDDLLTEAEAADLIGWSPVTLRAYRAKRDAALESTDDNHPDRDSAPPYERLRNGLWVRYRRTEVEAWLTRHPEVRDRDAIMRDTVSQERVCRLLGISRSTLRERRSRRRKGDSDAAPPHVHAGQAVRYRLQDVRAWAQRVRWPLAE